MDIRGFYNYIISEDIPGMGLKRGEYRCLIAADAAAKGIIEINNIISKEQICNLKN